MWSKFFGLLLFMSLVSSDWLSAQDYIEREYFKNGKAKNATVAAARYAEEGYYYTKFTTLVSRVDSSRQFADTALFFIKRSLMLADTALRYAPPSNISAISFIRSGIARMDQSDSLVREYYPIAEVEGHHLYGKNASLTLSNAVMDFFNASLLLPSGGEDDAEQYAVLNYTDEILRLEVDETSYQGAANEYEKDIRHLDSLAGVLNKQIALAPDQKTRFALRSKLEKIDRLLQHQTERLMDTSTRIEEIRQLLDRKYLDDVKGVIEADNLSLFETGSPSKNIEMDQDVPEGLVYKVQLGYFPSNVDIEHFHGLFPISGETVRPDQARFYAGLFFSYADASKGSDYIRNNAIPNAFVVPFYNGEKINISRAVEIEKQRGTK